MKTSLPEYINTPGLFLIAGPCVVEDTEMPMEIARYLKEICNRLSIPFIFKASYKKANRTRSDSFTGIGDELALGLIKEIGETLQIPVITDVHTAEEAEMAAEYADILQIPAFLCRQTDLLEAAGRTGRAVNIKKGQFLSALAMGFAIEKVKKVAPQALVLLTERGNMFGYHDLIVDIRNIPIMKEFDVPVVLDVTHSLQQPNTREGIAGGMPAMIDTLACAGVAAGADGLFLETHPFPEKAKSDGANMLRMNSLEPMLRKWIAIKKLVTV